MDDPQDLLQFIEMSGFASRRDEILSADEYLLLQQRLLENPRFGPCIRGSGGCRKIRVSSGGKGRRGGARVIYYYHDPRGRIYLLMAFAKNEKSALSPSEARILSGVVHGIKAARG